MFVVVTEWKQFRSPDFARLRTALADAVRITSYNVCYTKLLRTTDAAEAIAHGEVVFIAVGTPPDEDGSSHKVKIRDTGNC